MNGQPFDKQYYDRFYRDPQTRVAAPGQTRRLARFVCGYLKHLQMPVRSVLDVGCGLGYWRPVIRAEFPKASYEGVEVSEYLCRKFGWNRGSVVDYASQTEFDLVICQGVLQYLGARDAGRAIRNLARLCRGAMYLEALTAEDWRANCDRSRSDGATYHRPAAWYRKRLQKHFVSVGGGVFLIKPTPVVLFELEHA